MSVLVRIIGTKDDSDEYSAAERLQHIIEKSIPQTAIGEIILFPSATLYGQAVKDVDIMMIGDIKNYSMDISFKHDDSFSKDEVFLKTFCTTIEVKSHSITGIRREGTNLQVYYANTGWHNATKQSNDQRNSAMDFFKNTLGDHPYITNLIWFTEVSESELNNLLTVGNQIMPSNALSAMFDFREIVQKIAYQRLPKKYNNMYSIECGFNGRDTDSISKPLAYFSKVKSGIGELTRKKIEQITNAELGELEPNLADNSLNIFRGRAGTGKTIDLIKIAIKLVDEKESRVQILTYNRALVSDLRRLFALAELPDMFNEKCISVNTMQSFFYGLINCCLYDGNLSGEEYLSNYEDLLTEMIDFLKSGSEAKELINSLREDNPKLNWEYIFIDEAQDWSEDERNLILLLYEKDKLLIADGGQQFVRTIKPCDWTVVPERNSIKLKLCLRQKRNLVSFVNLYSSRMNAGFNKITASNNLVGGRIIVVKDKSKFFHIIKVEKNNMKKSGNESYDMLFAVPSTMVAEIDGHKHFKMLNEFEKNGVLLWDGTNDDNRLDFSIDLEESRVLQYESTRGLEGWTVCCMNFDEFMEMKELQYKPSNSANSLFLESSEDQKVKYLLNWALIPFTRAIDTLIITLQDEKSFYSKAILDLAEQHPDFISVE